MGEARTLYTLLTKPGNVLFGILWRRRCRLLQVDEHIARLIRLDKRKHTIQQVSARRKQQETSEGEDEA